MSVRTMARVWEYSQHSGTHLLMMLAIADFADDDGNAYPAVATLARKCRMKDRNARYLLLELSASRELTVVRNAGPKGANLYKITLPLQHVAPLQGIAPLQHIAATPAMDCRPPLQHIAPEPSLNHQEPSESEQARLSPKAGGKRKGNSAITLAAFLENCKAKGELAVPEDDPIFAYADEVGISVEMIEAAWREFKAYWRSNGKRKIDWRDTFRNAVRNNRARLWFMREGEVATWTTVGEQARRAAA